MKAGNVSDLGDLEGAKIFVGLEQILRTRVTVRTWIIRLYFRGLRLVLKNIQHGLVTRKLIIVIFLDISSYSIENLQLREMLDIYLLKL